MRRLEILRFGHRIAGFAGASAAIGVLALMAAPSATAHASLVLSTPSNDDVLSRSPAQVVLRFNEPVESAFGSIRVFDGEAQRVDEGGTTKPQADQVAIGVRSGLPRGTYTVAWAIVSEDSHPVRGAFVFHVGKPGAGATGVVDQVLDEQEGSRAVDVGFGVVRFLSFVLILLSVGGAIALAFVLRSEAGPIQRPLWMTLAVAGPLLALVSLVGIGLEGADASGLGLDAAARPSLVSDVLETQFGRVWLVRAVLALLLTAVAVLATRLGSRDRGLALAASLLGVGIALTPALSGHARVEGALAVLSDWAHVLAAAAWTGGLAFLLLALWRARGDRWPLASRAVPRFSTLAVVSVAVVLTAGALNGFLEIRSWSGLWETTYGRLFLLKVGLVLPLLALGAFNNRFSVPRLRAGIASAVERRRFLMATATELALFVVVIGVTAVLVAEQPAKAQAVVESGPVSRDVLVGPFHLTLDVDPARVGTNEIHLYLLDHSTGQPAEVDEVRIAASLPAAGIGPLRLQATPSGPGHAVVTAAGFPLAGQWRLGVDVRRGEFDLWSTQLTIPIRKES